MEHDETFRWILIAGFALMLPLGAFYRIRAHRSSREKLDRRQEGLFILMTLRPVGMLAVAGMIAFLVNPAWMRWSAVDLPLWLRWVGVGIGALGIVLFLTTLHHLGKNLTDTVVTRENATLVTNGPYRFVRHPFYGAATLAVVANALATANWALGLLGAGVIALLVLRTDTEEAKLIEKFGDDYREYMTRTGRFLPRLF